MGKSRIDGETTVIYISHLPRIELISRIILVSTYMSVQKQRALSSQKLPSLRKYTHQIPKTKILDLLKLLILVEVYSDNCAKVKNLSLEVAKKWKYTHADVDF